MTKSQAKLHYQINKKIIEVNETMFKGLPIGLVLSYKESGIKLVFNVDLIVMIEQQGTRRYTNKRLYSGSAVSAMAYVNGMIESNNIVRQFTH